MQILLNISKLVMFCNLMFNEFIRGWTEMKFDTRGLSSKMFEKPWLNGIICLCNDMDKRKNNYKCTHNLFVNQTVSFQTYF